VPSPSPERCWTVWLSSSGGRSPAPDGAGICSLKLQCFISRRQSREGDRSGLDHGLPLYQLFRASRQRARRPCLFCHPPPRRTGRADFPHPAHRKSFAIRHSQGVDSGAHPAGRSVHGVSGRRTGSRHGGERGGSALLLLSLAAQLPSQKGNLHRHTGLGCEPIRQPVRIGAFGAQAGSPFLDRSTTEMRPLGSTGITPHERPRLHAERAIGMSDSFQSDGSTRLGLAYQRR